MVSTREDLQSDCKTVNAIVSALQSGRGGSTEDMSHSSSRRRSSTSKLNYLSTSPTFNAPTYGLPRPRSENNFAMAAAAAVAVAAIGAPEGSPLRREASPLHRESSSPSHRDGRAIVPGNSVDVNTSTSYWPGTVMIFFTTNDAIILIFNHREWIIQCSNNQCRCQCRVIYESNWNERPKWSNVHLTFTVKWSDVKWRDLTET